MIIKNIIFLLNTHYLLQISIARLAKNIGFKLKTLHLNHRQSTSFLLMEYT